MPTPKLVKLPNGARWEQSKGLRRGYGSIITRAGHVVVSGMKVNDLQALMAAILPPKYLMALDRVEAKEAENKIARAEELARRKTKMSPSVRFD